MLNKQSQSQPNKEFSYCTVKTGPHRLDTLLQLSQLLRVSHSSYSSITLKSSNFSQTFQPTRQIFPTLLRQLYLATEPNNATDNDNGRMIRIIEHKISEHYKWRFDEYIRSVLLWTFFAFFYQRQATHINIIVANQNRLCSHCVLSLSSKKNCSLIAVILFLQSSRGFSFSSLLWFWHLSNFRSSWLKGKRSGFI